MKHNKIMKMTLKKHIRGLNKNHKQEDNTIDDIKLGSGLKKDVQNIFQIQRNNPDISQSLLIARNQSGSSIATGGGITNSFSKLSFGKKPTKAKFK